MVDEIPTPEEIRIMANKILLKGVPLKPSWGLNLLIPPETLGIIVNFSDKAYTLEERKALGVSEKAYNDIHQPLMTKNHYHFSFHSPPLNQYEWKWVNVNALYSEKVMGFQYYLYRWQNRGDEELKLESRHASVPAYKEIWKKNLSRLVFEYGGKYWAVQVQEVRFKVNEEYNMWATPPDDIINYKTKERMTEEELVDMVNNQLGYQFRIYMWDEMPTIEGSFGQTRVGTGENERWVERYDPDPLRLKGNGIVFPMRGIYHGKDMGNKNAFNHGDNHAKDGEVVTHTSSVYISFDSIAPFLIDKTKEWNIGFPMDSVRVFTGQPDIVANEHSADNTGGSYWLMRGNIGDGFLNHDYMW